jgi:hypothetical protein
LEHFKLAQDNKAFTLSHCWILSKDSKKWKDSFVLWQELEAKNKGNGNGNASKDGVINLYEKGEYLGNPASDGLPSDSWPPGYKASKTDIVRQAGSLVFQETFREIIVEKEEAIAEREERRRKDKETTIKSFVGLQERSVTADEAIAKARLLEAEAKAKALKAKVKVRLLESKDKARLLEADAKTKLSVDEAKLMAEENKIMLTDLESITDPNQRDWFEKRQKIIGLVMLKGQ